MNSLSIRDQVAARWHAFSSMRFPPGCADLDPNGVCLALVDSDSAGCINSYLDGPLPLNKTVTLRRCHDDLEHVLAAEIPTEVRLYFTELFEMAKLVLDAPDGSQERLRKDDKLG